MKPFLHSAALLATALALPLALPAAAQEEEVPAAESPQEQPAAEPVGESQMQTASADLVNADGESIGNVKFQSTASGILYLTVTAEGLPPGIHGFHVHETGECDPEGGFESAGGHYAGDHEHGVMAEAGPHPGDFPNVHVGEDGILAVEFFTDRLSLGSDGENPLMDDDGSAVMIHSQADDYRSQPSGEAGDRIACGVIQ